MTHTPLTAIMGDPVCAGGFVNDWTRRHFMAGTALALSQTASAQAQHSAKGLDMSAEAVLARRKEALELLQKAFGLPEMPRNAKLNLIDKNWEAWQQRTGELPPDFAAMPSTPFLPDPLTLNGTNVQNEAQWRKQREWIKEQYQHWILGKIPPPPGNVRGKVTAERKEGDATVQDVLLEFGPDHKGNLHLQVIIPPGKGPFPVLVTNHPRNRPWVNTAVRRGWIGCIESAADSYYGASDDSDKWIELYPEYDWSSLSRWAWAAMRALDYLLTLPAVDGGKVIVSGHSRNSKAVLVAAAFDERFAGVIPSRGNTGDGNAFRLTSPVYMNEPLEELTGGMPHWYHPRLRFFCGREHKLPVDTNLLMSLVAPRALMLSHAFTEHQGSALAIEQAYRSVRSVYSMLGAENKIALYQQPGEHSSTAEDIEQYLDFMDTVFGRKRFPKPQMWVHGYSYDNWRQGSGEVINPLKYPVRSIGDFQVSNVSDWEPRRAQIRKQIRWALGEEPPMLPFFSERKSALQWGMTSDGWLGQLLQRSIEGMQAFPFAFGDDLKSEWYIPDSLAKALRPLYEWFQARQAGSPTAGTQPPPMPSMNLKLPLVIWLHPYSYAMGYSRYAFWRPLVKQGFLVMAFDQIGFGSRNLHALRFYDRYPKWSLMGKMVADTLAAVENVSHLDVVDPSRIYVMGYSLGAKVGLISAALDDRIAGVVADSGFAPLRLDTPEKGSEGVRHYSHLHGLIPRFGAFAGHETRLPVDYDEILAAIAPRHLYLRAPTLDRFNPVEDVKVAVEHSRKVYRMFDKESALTFETPADFNQYDGDNQRPQYEWLSRLAALGELIEPKKPA